MSIKEFKIPYPYNRYFNSFYYYKKSSSEESLFLPDGHPELTISDTPMSISVKDKPFISKKKVLFWGQLKHSGCLTIPSSFNICGVKFQPWVLYLISKRQTLNLTDNIIDGSYIFSNDFIHEVQSLEKLNWNSIEEKIRFSKRLTELFISEFEGSYELKYNFIKTVTAIKKLQNKNNITHLLSHYQQSIRSLNYDFKKFIGITPKEYQTILRLRKSALALKSGQNILYTAIDLGYHDNSHFTREFKKLSQLTPKQFSKQKNNFIICQL